MKKLAIVLLIFVMLFLIGCEPDINNQGLQPIPQQEQYVGAGCGVSPTNYQGDVINQNGMEKPF